MVKKEKVIEPVAETGVVETAKSVKAKATPKVKEDAVVEDKPIDVQGDVLAHLAGKGITHIDAINVPHDRQHIEAVIHHLKLTGKVNGDASGRVWLA